MKAIARTQEGKTVVIDLPFYPTKKNFNLYKSQNPSLLIEIKLISSGENGNSLVKNLEFISKMDPGIPMKSDWKI